MYLIAFSSFSSIAEFNFNNILIKLFDILINSFSSYSKLDLLVISSITFCISPSRDTRFLNKDLTLIFIFEVSFTIFSNSFSLSVPLYFKDSSFV